HIGTRSTSLSRLFCEPRVDSRRNPFPTPEVQSGKFLPFSFGLPTKPFNLQVRARADPIVVLGTRNATYTIRSAIQQSLANSLGGVHKSQSSQEMQPIDNCPHFRYMDKIPLTKGAFREGTFGSRSGTRCPRADE